MSKKAITLTDLRDTLREQALRHVDLYVPYQHLLAHVTESYAVDEKGDCVTVPETILHTYGGLRLEFSKPVYSQLAERLSEDGKKTMPAQYMRLLQGFRDLKSAKILADNLNYCLGRRHGDRHRNNARKKLLIRATAPVALEREDPNDPGSAPTEGALAESPNLSMRAVLTDRYLRIDHLVLLKQLVMILSDRHDFRNNQTNWAAGVQAFNWRLTESNMDLLIANPQMAFDLNNPEAGVQKAPDGGFHQTGCAVGHGWLQASGSNNYGLRGSEAITEARLGGDKPLWVFPSARIRNSETGHGGLSVDSGIYEAVCNNTCMIGAGMKRSHVGGSVQLDEDASERTRRRTLELVMSRFSDSVASVFDPAPFETRCRDFLSLFDIEVPEGKVKEVVASACAGAGLSSDILDTVLEGYERLGSKNTLGDVQRAITQAAQCASLSGVASDLENLGGDLVAKGTKALSSEGRALLASV